MHDELADTGFVCVAIALDESTEALAPFVEGITMPVLLDRDHVVSELLAISNVPTVLWVDEHDRIVRPNSPEFGTDTFAEFTGITAEDHLDLVRTWVHTGAVPMSSDEAAQAVDDLSDEEVRARLHFRLAKHLRRQGRSDAADRHFDAALELAPLDFTIARASMPLRGGDPFGQEFFDLYERWQTAGSPYHGLRRKSAKTQAG